MIPHDTPHDFRTFLHGKAVDVIVQSEDDTLIDVLQMLIIIAWILITLVFFLWCFLLLIIIFSLLTHPERGTIIINGSRLPVLVVFTGNVIISFICAIITYFEFKFMVWFGRKTKRQGPWFAITSDCMYMYRYGIIRKYKWKDIKNISLQKSNNTKSETLVIKFNGNLMTYRFGEIVKLSGSLLSNTLYRIIGHTSLSRGTLFISGLLQAHLIYKMIGHNLARNVE